MKYWSLLAHSHWITLTLLGLKVRLCARCSGYVLGFSTTYLVYKMALLDSLMIKDQWIWQSIFILFALPLVVDWLTQSWGLRESSNRLRLNTGFLFGIDVFIYYQFCSSFGSRLIFAVIALIITLTGFIGKLGGNRSC